MNTQMHSLREQPQILKNYRDFAANDERDKIIAAAIGCIEGPYDRSRAITITGNEIERLYAIAYEDGRQAEREECVCIYKSLHNLYLDRGYPEQQMAFLIAAIDDFIEAIRARGDMK